METYTTLIGKNLLISEKVLEKISDTTTIKYNRERTLEIVGFHGPLNKTPPPDKRRIGISRARLISVRSSSITRATYFYDLARWGFYYG